MSPRRTVGYVKLEWTCPNCNTRNPGPQKTCVNCGAPQPDNVQFERAADEQLVADAALRAARAGADFICPYCGTRNKGDARVCVQCGGDLAEARRRVAGEELQPNIGQRRSPVRTAGPLIRSPTSIVRNAARLCRAFLLLLYRSPPLDPGPRNLALRRKPIGCYSAVSALHCWSAVPRSCSCLSFPLPL